jgi:hypothetical protein
VDWKEKSFEVLGCENECVCVNGVKGSGEGELLRSSEAHRYENTRK